jgi:ABC-type transport system substrate-binding protein
MIFSTAQPIFRVLATQLQEQLHRAGADATIRGYAPTQFIAPATSGGPVFGGRFDLALVNIYAAAGPDGASFFICSERAPRGFNLSRLCDRRLDALFDASIGEYERPRLERDEALIQQAIARDAPAIALGEVRWISPRSDRIAGFVPTPVTPYAGVWRWALEPHAQGG